jgi:hypothetical protein
MELLISIIDGGVLVALAVLAMLTAYLLQHVIHGIRVYFRFRGSRFVTCPETHQAAMVEVDAKSMSIQAILGSPCLRLSECSPWPMREDCGQDCLREIEARPAEFKFIAAYRAL